MWLAFLKKILYTVIKYWGRKRKKLCRVLKKFKEPAAAARTFGAKDVCFPRGALPLRRRNVSPVGGCQSGGIHGYH